MFEATYKTSVKPSESLGIPKSTTDTKAQQSRETSARPLTVIPSARFVGAVTPFGSRDVFLTALSPRTAIPQLPAREGLHSASSASSTAAARPAALAAAVSPRCEAGGVPTGGRSPQGRGRCSPPLSARFPWPVRPFRALR